MTGESEKNFLAQFGDVLISPSTKKTVKTSDALSGKTVMLYFSAHWCPPCRGFTPLLIDFYNNMKKRMGGDHDLEVVFVSLDKTIAEYEDYTSTMPWMCLPFDAPEEKKMKLARKYGAQGIPHLVVIDPSEERKVIAKDATEEVKSDPEGKSFPWKPKGFAEVFPHQILTKDGGLVDTSTLDHKYMMLYFSAHWCPPCRGFTPTLCDAYVKLMEERGDELEVVFVSSDRDEDAFKEYYGTMPFCALPYEHREAKEHLSKMFGVRGIPTLLMLGPVPEGGGDRPVITDKVRGFIDSGDLSAFPFHPKPYSDLAVGADGIDEKRSIVIFCENADDAEQDDIVDVIKEVSEKWKKDGSKEEDVGFFYSTSPGGVTAKLRELLNIKDKVEDVVISMVDFMDNGGYYISKDTDVTPTTIEEFIADPGERMQMTP